MKHLSIIIINYNTFELTSNCIRSIYEKLVDVDFEVVLVDNNSTQRNADDFLIEFPQINLIKNPINNGFAGGNNLGISKSKGQYILLLNSDTELLNNAPKLTLDYLITNPDIGIISAKLLNPDGTYQYNCRRFRGISWELLEIFRIEKWINPQKYGQRMLHHYFDGSKSLHCDWVFGAYMMFDRSILEKLPNNKLDERYFMYGEDTLWCLQFSKLGYKTFFLVDALVMHIHKGSANKSKIINIIKTTIKHNLDMSYILYPNFFLRTIFQFIYLSKQIPVYLWKRWKG